MPVPTEEAGWQEPRGGAMPEGDDGPRVAPPPHVARARWVDAAALAEGGLLADVGIILNLATVYLPLISPLVAPAVPTPYALLMLRRGPRATLLAAAVSTLLVTLLAGPHFGWRLGVEGLVGLLLGWAMRRRLAWPIVLGLGTVLVTTVAFVAALGAILVIGLPLHDILQELRNGLSSAAGVAAWLADRLGQHAAWLHVRPGLAAFGNLLLRYWPIFFFGYIAVVALPAVALYYAVANVTARVLGEEGVHPFPPTGSTGIRRRVRRTVLARLRLSRMRRRRAHPPTRDETASAAGRARE